MAPASYLFLCGEDEIVSTTRHGIIQLLPWNTHTRTNNAQRYLYVDSGTYMYVESFKLRTSIPEDHERYSILKLSFELATSLIAACSESSPSDADRSLPGLLLQLPLSSRHAYSSPVQTSIRKAHNILRSENLYCHLKLMDQSVRYFSHLSVERWCAERLRAEETF